jgi:hypothetical protein
MNLAKMNAVYTAAEHGDVGCLEALLYFDAPYYANDFGVSPLAVAAIRKHWRCVTRLLPYCDLKRDVISINTYKKSSVVHFLRLAYTHGVSVVHPVSILCLGVVLNPTIVYYALRLGMDVNYMGVEGVTPLYLACEVGNLFIVKKLIAFGANVHLPTAEGYTVFFAALKSGNLDLCAYLRFHFDFPWETPMPYEETYLFAAVESGSVAMVRWVHGVRAWDLTHRDFKDETVFMIAVNHGFVDVVSFLLTKNAPVDDALAHCGVTGNLSIARILPCTEETLQACLRSAILWNNPTVSDWIICKGGRLNLSDWFHRPLAYPLLRQFGRAFAVARVLHRWWPDVATVVCAFAGLATPTQFREMREIISAP